MNAIFYQNRTGCQWAYLPHDLPPKSATYYYFALWRDDGTDQVIHDLLHCDARERAGRREDPTAIVLDTQSVRAANHVPAATTGKDAAKKVPEPARPARAAPPDGPTATTSRAGTGEPADAVAAMASGEAIATTSPTYPQILAAFTGTDTMRAKDICLALGLDTLPKNTESVRAKLKRLVTQGALHENRPGLFTLAAEPEPTQPR